MSDGEKPAIPPLPSQSLPPHKIEPPRRNAWMPVLIGCFGAILVVMLVCGGLGWYAVSNVKRLATNVTRDAIVGMIESTELPDDEKQELIGQVDRVVDQYKAGKITLEQIGQIVEELGESPLIGAAVVFFAESKYLDASGFSDEEKTAARRTLQRTARGIHEGLLQMDQLEDSIAIISRTGPDGERQLKDQVTDEELREFLASLKQLADDAGVPDEEFTVDIGEAFKEVVDRALAK